MHVAKINAKVPLCFLRTLCSCDFIYFSDQANPPQHFGPVEAGFSSPGVLLFFPAGSR